jgi:hypothetical protein
MESGQPHSWPRGAAVHFVRGPFADVRGKIVQGDDDKILIRLGGGIYVRIPSTAYDFITVSERD